MRELRSERNVFRDTYTHARIGTIGDARLNVLGIER